MNTQKRTLFSASRATALAMNFGKKALACSLAYLMIPLGMGDIYAYAQTAPPPPPDQQQYNDQAPVPEGPPPESYDALSPDQLDQLVAPIALYPDSLIAQILAASTYPTEVADADHFVQQNQGVSPDQLGDMVNSMNWDPSVKALVAFPSVLSNLDRNLDWTSQLGNAYYNQPQDVMAAVQDMRQRAYQAGNLRSTSQLAVQYDPGDIVIAPANPAVVYVPWYDPWTVYGMPLSPWGGYYMSPRPAGFFFAAGLGIGFGIGIGIGHWNRWGWGWHNWGMGWRNRTVVYNRNVYVSRSSQVRNHGYYGHFDRNVSARNYNRTVQMRGRSNPALNRNLNRNNRNNNNFNRNNNRPNNNVRRAPNYNRNTRPNSNVRPAQRYNNNNRPQQRTPQQARPQFQQQARPDARTQPQRQVRPEARTQPQRQARPEARPQAQRQARPQARTERESHPAPKARSDNDKGHR